MPLSPSSTGTRASKTSPANTFPRAAESVVAAGAAAARVAAAPAGEALATSAAAPAAAATGDDGGHLLARDRLVELLVEPALAVGAPLRDVRDPFAPVRRPIDHFLVDRHPRPVLRALVGADRGPDDRRDDEADDERQPSGAAAGGEQRVHRRAVLTSLTDLRYLARKM